MIFFRVDLGVKEGLGHYKRVKSLIKYLNLKKYKIVVNEVLKNTFFENEKNIINLYEGKNNFTTEQKDANLFLNLFKNRYKNIIVIKDSYKLGFIWEKIIHKHCKEIISIEDFVKKKHFVDYYINHSPLFLNKNIKDIELLQRYNKKNCIFLLGPDYALFNSSINKKKKVNSDLVFYNGGSGNILDYEKIIKNIISIKKKTFKIILIVGPFAKNFNYVCKKFKKNKNIKVINQPKNILNYLIGTKIFISSAGVSMFESSFLKIPTLLFKMNFNQNLNDLDYEKLGHYLTLEKNDLKYTNKVTNLIDLMMKNRIQIKRMMSSASINYKGVKKNYQKALLKFKYE